MQSSIVREAKLVRHPESRSGAVRDVGARVSRELDGTLTISYSIAGDVSRMRVPARTSPHFVDGLWKHTCCECFISLKGRPEYHEFNFAPSGEWAAYAFAKYRDHVPLAHEALHPMIAVREGARNLEITASIPLDCLSSVHRCATLALALAAVIEEEDGVLSYWALTHPAGQPDFHQRGSFVLEIE